MANTKCEKCGVELETDVLKCPACGTPIAASTERRQGGKNARTMLLGIITVGLLAGVLIVALATTRNKTPEPTPKAEEKIDVEAVRPKAESGDARAQLELGAAYAKGLGVQESYTEAAKWYRKAADQGNAQAQLALAELYDAGQGVARDSSEAAKWYRKAAEQGLAAAQYDLAAAYVTGRGVPQNDAEALKWYRQAAERGDPLAQFNLGMRYLESKGVVADPVEAYKWLSLASAQSIQDADRARADLKTRMTAAQISEAERRVSAFVVKKPSRSG